MIRTLKSGLRHWFPALPYRYWAAKRCLVASARLNAWWAREYLAAALRGVEPLQKCEYQLFVQLAHVLQRTGGQWGLIDVGATNGVFTSALLRFFPGLFASFNFDPRRGCEAALEGRVSHFRYWHEAVGAEPGRLVLTEYGNGGLSSLLTLATGYQYASGYDMTVRGQYEVEVVRLDDRLGPVLTELAGTSWVLKIDTQGSELSVLQGSGQLLNEGDVKVLVMELMSVEKYAGQANYLQILTHLKARGYELYFIQEKYYEPTGQLSEFDVILVHRSLLMQSTSLETIS